MMMMIFPKGFVFIYNRILICKNTEMFMAFATTWPCLLGVRFWLVFEFCLYFYILFLKDYLLI